MKIIKTVLVLAVLSSVFLGCVQAPVGTPQPTASPTTTTIPTVVPTTVMPSPAPTMIPSLGPIKYIVWIDSDYGFYRIRAVQGNHSLGLPPDFNMLNFTTHVGDKVRWMNDDSYDFPLTIVSSEGLWTGSTGLMRYQGEHFEYIFNMTGTYDFSIREYPRIEHQKITVVP